VIVGESPPARGGDSCTAGGADATRGAGHNEDDFAASWPYDPDDGLSPIVIGGHLMSTPVPPEPAAEPTPPGRLRGRVIAGVIAAVAFAAGIGIGAAVQSEDEPAQQATASSDDGDTAALEEQVAALQGRLDDLTAERDGLQTSMTELEAAAAAAAEAAEAEAAAEEPVVEEPPAQEPPAADPPAADDDEAPVAGGVYTTGPYEFADVQVSDDGIGGFALRARRRRGRHLDGDPVPRRHGRRDPGRLGAEPRRGRDHDGRVLLARPVR